uniref:NADP-dependent oxidoreductase domain-containing protein n=1 Tax=Chromera velia CCMP2878 TaxID=1169474 RepID=A0A0G4I877_9ALVE|eukprot:Cvel_1962.t1-p1 / transcript=Cvel_1962.t1 / gene=Cvel_1962 / organism=Chromera_velia_CCMP2878 / gene_product=Uncharacterized oxidoreductase YtbE, putative / transcript_product=Uncharacterized oxidoreductase YtbE, putative / location=Cvel_scaffold74:99336-103339(+) / protein_length=292 / sequence_SO=supercontig / SO=protein_coding / is_pseudo=false
MSGLNTFKVKTLAGIEMPRLVYGTAWKKETTTALVMEAVRQGFRGIDTACQPRHYREDLVGEAVDKLIQAGEIKREDIFLQTKYTPVGGQDMKSIPYDPKAPVEDQVKQSFAVSLKNLRTSYIDSLVMHSPMRTHEETMRVWRVFESFEKEGKVRQLGISNIYDPDRLKSLYEEAEVKPSVVQNRFYPDTGYDAEIRSFCLQKGIFYQSFWTLTANPHFLKHPVTQTVAKQRNWTPQQAFFRFVMDLGITPLTGTTDSTHMKEDLESITAPSLQSEEFKTLEKMLDPSFYRR